MASNTLDLLAKATARPWSVEAALSEDCDIAGPDFPDAGSPVILASCFPGDKDDEDDCDPITHKQAKANAALIVHLVNTAEEKERELERLRTACTSLLALVSILHADVDHPALPFSDDYEAVKAAREALGAKP